MLIPYAIAAAARVLNPDYNNKKKKKKMQRKQRNLVEHRTHCVVHV